MTNISTLVEKALRFNVRAHKDGKLVMAYSPDLPGFNVVGTSDAEIEEKLPGAVRDFLEMSGYTVVRFDLTRDRQFEEFVPTAFLAQASLSDHHDG